MFTGIVITTGYIQQFTREGQGARITIHAADLPWAEIKIGDSIAVNGICLSVVELGEENFLADLSPETLERTTIGELPLASRVNLELALRFSDRLGGHLVSGHVDGIGRVEECSTHDQGLRLVIRVPDGLARYIAVKGSIAVDGVSLTVNRVTGALVFLYIIPHTLQATQIGEYQPGRKVNIEVDLLARYLERLLDPSLAAGLPTRLQFSK